jgi:hypothetical protein
MTTRASVLAAILAACPAVSTASTEPIHIENFSFMIRDVSQETLREIAGRVATKHRLTAVEVKRRDPAQADNRVPIVEFRGHDVVFYLARYLAPPGCVLAEFRVRGSGGPRGAASLREDLQQELTAVLADRVQLHDHASCDKAF